jgi:3-oxoacyl-[acyl-carrier protein] reductase
VPKKFYSMRFKDKIALVTGGTRGIGSAIGKRFLQEGAQLVVTYSQDKDQARKFQNEVESAQAQVHQADASDFDQMKALLDQILKQYGRLDILVNNAGIRRDNLVMFMSEKEWHDVLRVNLQGTFICSKLALKPMIAQRWGRMINIVSPSGIMGRQGQANYAAAKGGVASFTKSLAREVGKIGITVNAVSPGVIDTDMTRSLPAKTLAELKQSIPMGHFGQPDDVSGTVLFLASEEASYITGQVISVDGGLT